VQTNATTAISATRVLRIIEQYHTARTAGRTSFAPQLR